MNDSIILEYAEAGRRVRDANRILSTTSLAKSASVSVALADVSGRRSFSLIFGVAWLLKQFDTGRFECGCKAASIGFAIGTDQGMIVRPLEPSPKSGARSFTCNRSSTTSPAWSGRHCANT